MNALFYLLAHSFWNGLVSRLKRLRQPKYLIGAVVGGLYFYFYFFRFALGSRKDGAPDMVWVTPDTLPFLEVFGGAVIALILLLAWVIPHSRAALTFSEAEIAFLFPAPVTRRTLIQFKLLRSQVAILFTVLIFTLVFRRGGTHLWMTAIGWWLVFSVLSLHFLVASFLRTMLLDHGFTHWTRRAVILGLVGAGSVAVGLWLRQTAPSIEDMDWSQPGQWLEQWRPLVEQGPLPILLYPFRLIVRPYLAAGTPGFLHTVWPVLLILAAHYFWVVRVNLAFEEASIEASRKFAARVEAARRGQSGALGRNGARRAPFRLGAEGPVEIAFLWKNLLGAGRFYNLRLVLALTVGVGVMLAVFSSTAPVGGWAGITGIVAVMLLAWTLVLGPQLAAQDLRQDLRMVDQLKVYPLRGWRVVAGQLLAPAAILTTLQWLLIPVAVFGLLHLDSGTRQAPGNLVALGVAAAVVALPLNLLGLVIPNAAVLLFPAWFLTDKTAPAGIEATGQRIVMFMGQMLVMLVGLLPAAAVFAAVAALMNWLVGWWLAAPVAGMAAALVLLAEAALAVMLMGRWFDRLDVSLEGGK